MRLSTKACYGLALMISLAKEYGTGPVFLSAIADKEKMSLKYLSRIVILLKRAGLVASQRGAHGGYMVSRKPENIALKEIVTALEGSVKLVNCLMHRVSCGRTDICRSKAVWAKISLSLEKIFDSKTLADIAGLKTKKIKKKRKIND